MLKLPLILAQHEGTFFFPPEASTFAKETDFLYMAIYYISLFFFVLVVGAMVLFAIKFRRRPGYQGDSSPMHNNVLEITWTIIPTLIVCWIFARGVYGYMDMMRPPPDTIDINVTARSWAWTFQYPNGAISTELHVPVDKAIRLRMRSEDVLHSFFVPAFRAKTDVVPGRVNIMWFEPILKGKYPLFCTEYCGERHSEMLADVFVESEEEYEAWLAEAAKPPEAPVAHGEWLYERMGCKSCHSIEENKVVVGPSYYGTFGTTFTSSEGEEITVDENYIRESILEPQKVYRPEFVSASQMPSYQGKLNEQEITALIAFIQALEDGEISDEERNAGAESEEGEDDQADQDAEQADALSGGDDDGQSDSDAEVAGSAASEAATDED